jgi:hypothetical protein
MLLYESFDDLHIKRQHTQTILEGLMHDEKGSVTSRKEISLDRRIGNKDGISPLPLYSYLT